MIVADAQIPAMCQIARFTGEQKNIIILSLQIRIRQFLYHLIENLICYLLVQFIKGNFTLLFKYFNQKVTQQVFLQRAPTFIAQWAQQLFCVYVHLVLLHSRYFASLASKTHSRYSATKCLHCGHRRLHIAAIS